jgi:hypothetical protein
MSSAQGAATFSIVAKDAASKVIGKIGKSMGGLKSAAGTAFKALGAGALAAAAAIGALAVTAIKSAIEDEASTSRLNAALKARGLAVKALTPAINAQIAAGQKLGFTDDQTRASLEAATRFTKDFTKAQQISKVAQDVARATGVDLATATVNVGKAYAGAGGRLLKTLGITDKGIKGQAALDAIFGKVQGSADAYAQTVGGKFEIAQDRMNEQIEALGYRLLPAVSGAMDFIATSVLPITDAAFQAIGDAITSVGDEISKPGGMLESVGAVAGEFLNSMKPGVEAVASALGPFIQAVLDLAGALWGDGKGPLAVAVTFIGEALNNLMLIIKPVLEILTAIINAINGVITGAAKLGDNPANNQGFQFSGGAAPSAGGGYTYGGTGTGGGITIKNNISFGQDAVSFVDTSLGRTVSRGSTRTAP